MVQRTGSAPVILATPSNPPPPKKAKLFFLLLVALVAGLCWLLPREGAVLGLQTRPFRQVVVLPSGVFHVIELEALGARKRIAYYTNTVKETLGNQ